MHSRPKLNYFMENGKCFIDFSKLEITPGQTALNLSDTSIMDSDVESLVSFLHNHPEITSLDLSKNAIHDEGAHYLSQTRNLTLLDLNTNFIKDDGARYLSENPNFISLNLCRNLIKDQGAFYLSRSKSQHLTSLNLSNNYIKKSGAMALKTLITNPILQQLNLTENFFVMDELLSELLQEQKTDNPLTLPNLQIKLGIEASAPFLKDICISVIRNNLGLFKQINIKTVPQELIDEIKKKRKWI